jgi:hypothetical protein
MTIDERLEKLVERHEALSHSVELLAGMHRQTERELKKLSRLARLILIDHEERRRTLEGDEDGHEVMPS